MKPNTLGFCSQLFVCVALLAGCVSLFYMSSAALRSHYQTHCRINEISRNNIIDFFHSSEIIPSLIGASLTDPPLNGVLFPVFV